MVEKYGKRNFDIDVMKPVVVYIWHANHVNLMSWETFRVKYSRHGVVLSTIVCN